MDSLDYMNKNGNCFFAGSHVDDSFDPYSSEGHEGNSSGKESCSRAKTTVFNTAGEEVCHSSVYSNFKW
jgi:hypothetical protein